MITNAPGCAASTRAAYNPPRHEGHRTTAEGFSLPMHGLWGLLHRARRLLCRSIACRAAAHSGAPEGYLALVSPALHRGGCGRYAKSAMGRRSLRVSRRRAALPHLPGAPAPVPHVSVLAGTREIVRALATRKRGVRRHGSRRGYSARGGASASVSISRLKQARSAWRNTFSPCASSCRRHAGPRGQNTSRMTPRSRACRARS